MREGDELDEPQFCARAEQASKLPGDVLRRGLRDQPLPHPRSVAAPRSVRFPENAREVSSHAVLRVARALHRARNVSRHENLAVGYSGDSACCHTPGSDGARCGAYVISTRGVVRIPASRSTVHARDGTNAGDCTDGDTKRD